MTEVAPWPNYQTIERAFPHIPIQSDIGHPSDLYFRKRLYSICVPLISKLLLLGLLWYPGFACVCMRVSMFVGYHKLQKYFNISCPALRELWGMSVVCFILRVLSFEQALPLPFGVGKYSTYM